MRSALFKRIAEGVTGTSRLFARISDVLVLVLMGIAVTDVFVRKFRFSFQGSVELMEVLFCVICFFSFAYAWVKGDHIGVEIVTDRFSPCWKRRQRAASAFVGILVFGGLCYGAFRLAVSSFVLGDTTLDLGISHGIPQGAIALGSGLFALQCAVSFLKESGGMRDSLDKESDANSTN